MPRLPSWKNVYLSNFVETGQTDPTSKSYKADLSVGEDISGLEPVLVESENEFVMEAGKQYVVDIYPIKIGSDISNLGVDIYDAEMCEGSKEISDDNNHADIGNEKKRFYNHRSCTEIREVARSGETVI